MLIPSKLSILMPTLYWNIFARTRKKKNWQTTAIMLWSTVWTQYQDAAMGVISNSNFERGIYTAHTFTNPHLVTFMESHDEERTTFKCIKYGNSNGLYDVKDSSTALKRMELNTAFMLTIPGPKMIFEFGELGYDFSRCYLSTNGDGGDCNTKLDPKPIRWDYLQVVLRKRVYDIYSSLNKLRYHGWYKDIFLGNNISIARNLGGAFKSLIIRSATDSSQIVVVGNFDITDQTSSVTFPTGGTWYDYLRGTTFAATGSAQSMTLIPGEYHVYLNRNLINAVTTPVIDINNPGTVLQLFVYPNPVEDNSIAEVYVPERGNVLMELWSIQGQKVKTIHAGILAKGKHVLTLSDKTNYLASGLYLLKAQTKNNSLSVKVLIK